MRYKKSNYINVIDEEKFDVDMQNLCLFVNYFINLFLIIFVIWCKICKIIAFILIKLYFNNYFGTFI